EVGLGRAQGGGAPSGHCRADRRTGGPADRKIPMTNIRPTVRISDGPTPLIVAPPSGATPQPAAGSGGSSGLRRIRGTAAHTTTAATVVDLPTGRGLAPPRRRRRVQSRATRPDGSPWRRPRSRVAPG